MRSVPQGMIEMLTSRASTRLHGRKTVIENASFLQTDRYRYTDRLHFYFRIVQPMELRPVVQLVYVHQYQPVHGYSWPSSDWPDVCYSDSGNRSLGWFGLWRGRHYVHQSRTSTERPTLSFSGFAVCSNYRLNQRRYRDSWTAFFNDRYPGRSVFLSWAGLCIDPRRG